MIAFFFFLKISLSKNSPHFIVSEAEINKKRKVWKGGSEIALIILRAISCFCFLFAIFLTRFLKPDTFRRPFLFFVFLLNFPGDKCQVVWKLLISIRILWISWNNRVVPFLSSNFTIFLIDYRQSICAPIKLSAKFKKCFQKNVVCWKLVFFLFDGFVRSLIENNNTNGKMDFSKNSTPYCSSTLLTRDLSECRLNWQPLAVSKRLFFRNF